MLCVCTACLFGVSAPQQLLAVAFSKGGEMMGAALVQVAFNLGNAVGAYCGGLPITYGLPYNYPALVAPVCSYRRDFHRHVLQEISNSKRHA